MTDGAIEFFVLTGFLGSGKTTLLRDFLEGCGAADTAVIVNEVGEIGLDGIVLRESGDSVPMAMLSNGCVCCQVGSDLAFTIDRLIVGRESGPRHRLMRVEWAGGLRDRYPAVACRSSSSRWAVARRRLGAAARRAHLGRVSACAWVHLPSLPSQRVLG